MGYGFAFTSKTRLRTLAEKHAPSHPDTQKELEQALKAYEEHKQAEEKFYEFLILNNELEKSD